MAHLTDQERMYLETRIHLGDSIPTIAHDLSKNRTTVVREIRKRAVESKKVAKGLTYNSCANRAACSIQFLCGNCVHPSRKDCRACPLCNQFCYKYHEERCPRLARPPYVCNGCSQEASCTLNKRYYIPSEAQRNYRDLLVGSRTGLDLTPEQRVFLDQTLSRGLKQGQSVHHVLAAHPDELPWCERTVYDYIRAGLLPNVKRIDLPVAPKMKPRKRTEKHVEHKVDKACRQGRTLEDYTAYLKAHPDAPVTEMDTVEGRKGGKVVLTLNHDPTTLMLAFLREHNTSQSVIDIFNRLEQTLGLELFQRLFPVILTDNGTEFSNPAALEISPFAQVRRTRIFYCHPYCSWQKPHVENNHLNLRKIFPKGESMDFATQDLVDRAVSNLNSMLRSGLNNLPTIRLFEKMYGQGILEKLGIQLVPADKVKLTPNLVRS